MAKELSVAAGRRHRTPEGVREQRRREAEEWKKVEAIDLQASDIACSVADAWLSYTKSPLDFEKRDAFGLALEKLEHITRSSAMRKVRP